MEIEKDENEVWKIVIESDWYSDEWESSHKPFRFAPPWEIQPSIMHHMSPSNSREPSNRILATATNCRLLVRRPVAEQRVRCTAANREEGDR